ncbi:hypothetical protein H1P_5700002 [Hyella patelloides LEGE 07179]|uniref:HEAT repeat domain-containing protein n=1 Tax=Hyella patelloides LEGE 07179 TaxID=945734 RepID=A0A563W0M2_9CYAN|nr:hypothetical protein [Hyella patelloides]VEP17239.1 hypothetical protein H1P_5700002 [Hyella patelloides LEGE 07179]
MRKLSAECQIQSSSHPDTIKNSIVFLGQISKIHKGDNEIIKTLVSVINNTENKTLKYHEKSIAWKAAEVLGTIDRGNTIAINKLVYFIENAQNE